MAASSDQLFKLEVETDSLAIARLEVLGQMTEIPGLLDYINYRHILDTYAFYDNGIELLFNRFTQRNCSIRYVDLQFPGNSLAKYVYTKLSDAGYSLLATDQFDSSNVWASMWYINWNLCGVPEIYLSPGKGQIGKCCSCMILFPSENPYPKLTIMDKDALESPQIIQVVEGLDHTQYNLIMLDGDLYFNWERSSEGYLGPWRFLILDVKASPTSSAEASGGGAQFD